MKVEPYLFYGGRCAEALSFYQSAIGAEILVSMRFSESPDQPSSPECAMPGEWQDKIMHAQIRIGESTLMASDGMPGQPPGFGGFSLAIDAPDEATARKWFDALGAGGEVEMPMEKTFFAQLFGAVRDRFGVSWMIGVFA